MSRGAVDRPTKVGAGADAIVIVVRGDVEIARWQLTPAGRVDLALVDQLARWQLRARRHGCSLAVRGASPALVELVRFVGLDLGFT